MALDKYFKVSYIGNIKIQKHHRSVKEKRMKLQILGSGCPSCKKLEANAVEAVRESGVAAEIEKVTDMQKIVEFGVMSTPALAVDGVVKSAGRILSKDQIMGILKGGR